MHLIIKTQTHAPNNNNENCCVPNFALKIISAHTQSSQTSLQKACNKDQPLHSSREPKHYNMPALSQMHLLSARTRTHPATHANTGDEDGRTGGSNFLLFFTPR